MDNDFLLHRPYDNNNESVYRSLLDRTTSRIRLIDCHISKETFMMTIIIIINIFTFILLIFAEETLKPNYKDIKFILRDVNLILPSIINITNDLQEMKPDIYKLLSITNNICNSSEYEHLCL